MSHIHIERDGSLAVLTIARRERMNSLDVETARDFRKAGLELARDKAVRAVILTGEGGMFSSGADLKYIFAGGAEADLDYLAPGAHGGGYGPIFKQILEYIHSTISEIRRAPKPFIAAVDGAAAAGGLGIALSCDLVIASERAWFEWAYFKTGLSGAESSTFFLPRLVGFHKAMELALTSPRLSAREALALGLINDVVPDAELDTKVRELGQRLAAAPTAAIASAKALINRASGMDRLDQHLDAELAELERSANGANFAEGISAFFEKRPPQFESE
ncbi:MAG: enoyl-CoA hydratase/isomerase family protein [Myxococcales bacterium]|nr:enoyl-CoA hydratase/isomerase family protein [Myxococcales bacterium]